MAVRRNIDEVRMTVDANRGDDLVLLGIDHTDVVRGRIYDVDLVPDRVGINAGWFGAHLQGPNGLERAQIDHSDGIALAVGDIGILAVERSVNGEIALVEVPPAGGGEQGNQNCD